jgi:hypothetical protein
MLLGEMLSVKMGVSDRQHYTSHCREREREQEEHLHLSWLRACALMHRMINCQHVSLVVGKKETIFCPPFLCSDFLVD